MRGRRMLVIAAVAGAVLGAGAGARAGDPATEASRAFETATKAAARGDYLTAAEAFLQANRIQAHPIALYNAALAFEEAGQNARAADTLDQVLAGGGLPGPQGRDASSRLRKLETRLAVIAIQAPQGSSVSVAHRRDEPAPLRAHLQPGEYVVTVRHATGASERRTVRANAQENLEVVFDLPAPSTAAPAPSALSTAAAPAEKPKPSTWPGWVLVGTGGALAATSAVLGLRALSARDEFNASGYTDREAHDRAASYRTWTNVALAGAVVAGGAGAYLLAWPGDGEQAAGAGPIRWNVAIGGGGLSAVGRFE